ncbi:MAG: TonB-dependent receptor plug domain-containing protein, partial [Gammaproteobacteria bacterium]
MNSPATGFYRRTLLATGITLACALSPLASAQDTGETGDSTVVYPADYFDEWIPVTAQDMLSRIPGQGSGGGPGGGFSGGGRGGPPGGGFGNPTRGGRGLGSGSGGTEIMINGKRTAGKNNSTQGLLGRIPADQVQEIQIIRGTSGELDVRGSTQVVNVVLFQELSTNSVSWEATANMAQDGEFTPQGSVSLSGQREALDYLITLRSNPFYSQHAALECSIVGIKR